MGDRCGRLGPATDESALPEREADRAEALRGAYFFFFLAAFFFAIRSPPPAHCIGGMLGEAAKICQA
jgi:hypothetical protein